MKISVNLVIQLLGTVLQALNIATPLLSRKWQPAAAAVIGLVQGFTAFLAHWSNPDGTSAHMPYQPQGSSKAG